MGTRDAVARWVDGWQRAWPRKDVEGIAAMYAREAPYRSHPFREPDTARSYVERAFGDEDLVEAWFGEPLVDGERAVVEYWAVLREPAGDEVTIAGAAVLCFGDDGLVVDHRDYWTQTDGARRPPEGWGA